MLKKILEAIRVKAFMASHRKYLAQILRSGRAIRKEPKPVMFDAIITDDEVVVDYLDGRFLGQRQVTPRFIRPFGLRRDKF